MKILNYVAEIDKFNAGTGSWNIAINRELYYLLHHLELYEYKVSFIAEYVDNIYIFDIKWIIHRISCHSIHYSIQNFHNSYCIITL